MESATNVNAFKSARLFDPRTVSDTKLDAADVDTLQKLDAHRILAIYGSEAMNVEAKVRSFGIMHPIVCVCQLVHQHTAVLHGQECMACVTVSEYTKPEQ